MATVLAGRRQVGRACVAATVPGQAAGAGLRLLVPGYPQWVWRQRERALVLSGSFTTALLTAAFAWGTPTGLALLAFAFVTHVVSVADAVRQNAFPTPGRALSLAGVSGGLAVGVYAPALTAAALLAWPGMRGGSEPEGFLVNCWAFRRAEPVRGDLIWYRTTPWGEPRVGRVVAGHGQEVDWSDNRLRVDGRALYVGAPCRSSSPPSSLTYRVPDGHVLVSPDTDLSGRRGSEGLLIVAHDQIVGRAWARMYPVHGRQLL